MYIACNSMVSPQLKCISLIQAKIPLRDSLSIYPFVGDKVGESPPSMYRLRGVVHHVGSTAFSGHYTTCAKRTISGKKSDASCPQDNNEQWVFFDDRVGVEKSMNYVIGNEKDQRSCYMALYDLVEAKATNEADDSNPGESKVDPWGISETITLTHVHDDENYHLGEDLDLSSIQRKQYVHDDEFESFGVDPMIWNLFEQRTIQAMEDAKEEMMEISTGSRHS